MVIREYYELTKPRMVMGNLLVAGAAFIFASGDAVEWGTFFFTLLGLGFVIAAACVFNNYFDREIDARMERTKGRALAQGRIAGAQALWFGAALLILGIVALQYHTNTLTLGVALLGFASYVLWYTPLKPYSPIALFVGAIAGATPPVVGYTAVTNEFDLYALALFAALYLWQIPHFLAISIYRFEEYRAAGVPLYVKNPPSPLVRRRARAVFYSSLVVLLLFCVVLVVVRLFT